MKRRTVLAGLGSLTASSLFVAGTGAFTSVSAKRSVAVETAGDNDALLRLKELGEGKRSIEDDGRVEFSFPGFQERLDDPDLGLGVDSVYEFDRDAEESDKSTPTEGLLRIENRGTQSVAVRSRFQSENDLEIELYDVADSDRTALRDDPPELGVGDSVDIGFRIRTFGAEIDTFEETLTIVAEATDD